MPAPDALPSWCWRTKPDEDLANRLLRDGAQDVLVKAELECAPLARAIRYAIERQRLGRGRAGPPRSSTISPAFSLATRSSQSPRTAATGSR